MKLTRRTRNAILAWTLGTVSCSGDDASTKRTYADNRGTEKQSADAEQGNETGVLATVSAESSTALNASSGKGWHQGWTKLMSYGGVEYSSFPRGKAPASIKAVPMKDPKPVKLTDYFLRPTGYTTMWGHALNKYNQKNYRSDGVRWDTPTQWVPAMVGGGDSKGNLTLYSQFGGEIPNYWSGAKPMSNQADWIFHVDYKSGAIMEIYDRQHFGTKNDKVFPSFSEVVATGYWKALYWAPAGKFDVRSKSAFGGSAEFVSNHGKRSYGYSKARVINRYETFTVPPARNMGKDCPAAEFKDVIAYKHQQWWYDAATKTTRGDYMLIYMAKGIGWIYLLLNDATFYDQNNNLKSGDKHFLHLSPVGYIKQQGAWDRKCPHEFRDMLLKK